MEKTFDELMADARDASEPRFEGENASFAFGLANCSRCEDKTNLTHDYIFIENKPVCTGCATFKEAPDLAEHNGKFRGHRADMDRMEPALVMFENRRKLAYSMRNEAPHVYAFMEAVATEMYKLLAKGAG